MLLAKEVVPIEADFINVLEHIPGTKAEKQSYFQSKGIRVPRTNYDSMWEVLTERLHHSGAAQIVFEYLQAYMPDRLRELLRIAARGKAVELRANEPAIVWGLFFQNGHLRRIGELFLENRPTHGGRPSRPVATTAPVQTAKAYEIAISFAGENRQLVGEVARELDSKGVRVFYDEFERVRLLGKDLVAYFAEVYAKQAKSRETSSPALAYGGAVPYRACFDGKVSSHGLRVLTERFWKRNIRLIVQSSEYVLWGDGRVVYCQGISDKSFAIGLELLARTGDWIYAVIGVSPGGKIRSALAHRPKKRVNQ